MKHFLSSHILRMIYNSLISPHLNIGILSWVFEGQRLKKLQKKAVRIITSSKFNAHSETLFKSLNIIKIEHIFHLKCLNFYYKFINGSIPEYIFNPCLPKLNPFILMAHGRGLSFMKLKLIHPQQENVSVIIFQN